MKKEDVHLQLSEELAGIDAELERAMDALSQTNDRIDSFLNDDGESIDQAIAYAEVGGDESTDEAEDIPNAMNDDPED